MDTNLVALLCLACVVHGHTVGTRKEHIESSSHTVQNPRKIAEAIQAKSLSSLLLAFNAAPGWHILNAGRAHSFALTTTNKHVHSRDVSMLESSKPLKVLCLQPKGGTGQKFLTRLQPIRQAVGDGVEWDTLDAPQVLDGPEELQWWINPKGKRSYTADAYEGDDVAIKKVEDAWTKHGPYDVILGFSQGAMLAAILIARGALGQGDVRPRGAVLMGAAMPKPYEKLMSKYNDCEKDILSLHCLSRHDKVNPPEMGEKIASCFGSNAQIHWHASGHVTPGDKGAQDSNAIAAVADFLTGMMTSSENSVAG